MQDEQALWMNTTSSTILHGGRMTVALEGRRLNKIENADEGQWQI